MERVAERLLAGDGRAAALAEPEQEVGLVLVAQQHLVERFAVHDARHPAPLDLLVAVDQVAGVARLVHDHLQADEPVAGLLRDLLQRPPAAGVGEDVLLVEAPAAQADAHLTHLPALAARSG
ncbi:hypothetical protein ACFQRB_12205 [Halobaculum litoreum]|uniref:Uncharacterized protein n=1 Tax=Halobaculum litoreum TaxID=3031998 RepID=A0ABD5XPF4_9EURY